MAKQAWLAGSTALPLSAEFQQNHIHLYACIHLCICRSVSITLAARLGPNGEKKNVVRRK